MRLCNAAEKSEVSLYAWYSLSLVPPLAGLFYFKQSCRDHLAASREIFLYS